MIQYLKILDDLNAKILEGLGRYGPRNISVLAKALNVPQSTVAFRIKKLVKNGFLRVHAIPNYSKLGLKHGFLLIESPIGSGEKLQKAILNIGYWTHVLRCYGKIDGFYATLAFPAEYENELFEYLKKIIEHYKISNQFFYWTTNPVYVDPNFSWFDFRRRTWSLKWQDWLNEILNAGKNFSEVLLDTLDYTIHADEIDLFLVKELEKDGSIEFTRLSEAVKMTPEGIGYRYRNHIVGRNLIHDYQVAIFPYPLPVSEACTFIVEFTDQKSLAMFFNTLFNKPFIRNFFKVLGLDILIVNVYVLKNEFTKLLDAMNFLVINNIVKNYSYVFHDLNSFRRQTISYEYFSGKKWMFDKNSLLKNLP